MRKYRKSEEEVNEEENLRLIHQVYTTALVRRAG